jgi:hypothetical protein
MIQRVRREDNYQRMGEKHRVSTYYEYGMVFSDTQLGLYYAVFVAGF